MLFVSLPLFLTLCLIRQYLILRRRVLSQSERGRKSRGRREMEREGRRERRAEMEGVREMARESDRGRERAIDGWREGGRKRE